MLLKLTAHDQKNRFRPKNQNTKKWKTKATATNNPTQAGLSNASGNKPSHKMNAQLQHSATRGRRNTLSGASGPYKPEFKNTVKAWPLRHSGRFNLTQPETK